MKHINIKIWWMDGIVAIILQVISQNNKIIALPLADHDAFMVHVGIIIIVISTC